MMNTSHFSYIDTQIIYEETDNCKYIFELLKKI